jgi:hypothetical protein
MPAATLVMRRSLPGAPTDTVLDWVATDPAPNAIALLTFAPIEEFAPTAVDCVVGAVRRARIGAERALLLPAAPLARLPSPKAAPPPEACAPLPTATEAVAIAFKPMAMVPAPVD